MPRERDELVRLHIIHEFDRDLAVANLRGCYGRIARRFYGRMMRDLKGSRVLDAGCGFGQFSHLCVARGLDVHSIDIDERSLAVARDEYRLNCFNESVYQTSLPDDSIDTIVSNDAICHFDVECFLREAIRLGAQRIIVHDSNTLNPLLLANRRATEHEEYRSYTPLELVKQFDAFDFRCARLDFVNFFSLPISGGFQKSAMPIVSRFPSLIYAMDCAAEWACSFGPAARKFAFRFVAVFDKY